MRTPAGFLAKKLLSFVRNNWPWLGLLVVAMYIALNYDEPWTGFSEFKKVGEDTVPPKRLWDWLELLIVPMVLAWAALWFESSRRRSDQEVENDRQRQKVLDEYFSYISDMLMEGKLDDGVTQDKAPELARIRTLTALRELDAQRKSLVLQFLVESRLVGKGPILDLNGADFREAQLDGANLSNTEMRGVHFENASLRGAFVVNADLSGSDFAHADFSGANLQRTILKQATLNGAKFTAADVTDVDFSEAEMNHVHFTGQQRQQAKNMS